MSSTATLERPMFDLAEFLHYVDRVRERTRRVAACIPPEHIEWSYKPDAFTLGDLVRHIAVTERFIWAETAHDRPSRYATHGRELADGRAAILALLDRLHEESMAQFRLLTPEMLATTCPRRPPHRAMPAPLNRYPLTLDVGLPAGAVPEIVPLVPIAPAVGEADPAVAPTPVPAVP